MAIYIQNNMQNVPRYGYFIFPEPDFNYQSVNISIKKGFRNHIPDSWKNPQNWISNPNGPVGIRYIRVGGSPPPPYVGRHSTTYYDMHWKEIQAFDKFNVNQARGKSVSSNTSVTNIGYAVDGNINTNQSSYNSGYIQVDLGAIYEIVKVSCSCSEMNDMYIRISRNGSTWYTISNNQILDYNNYSAFGYSDDGTFQYNSTEDQLVQTNDTVSKILNIKIPLNPNDKWVLQAKIKQSSTQKRFSIGTYDYNGNQLLTNTWWGQDFKTVPQANTYYLYKNDAISGQVKTGISSSGINKWRQNTNMVSPAIILNRARQGTMYLKDLKLYNVIENSDIQMEYEDMDYISLKINELTPKVTLKSNLFEMENSTTYTFKLDYLDNNNQLIDSQYYQIKTSQTDPQYFFSHKILLHKDNNYYYQNPDDGSINLIGPIISYEDFENYGIENVSNILNIPDIINNNYSILQYREQQNNLSNINSEITYIPNNQLIKIQDYIFTQDFSNIDKITLNQSNLNILNNENISQSEFNYSSINEFDLITTSNLLNNTIININNITFNHTSNNVNIGLLTSFDNETWQYYNGEEFISENLTNPTNLNTIDEIQSLFTNYNTINLNELYFQFVIEYLDETSSFTLNSINLNITNDSQLKILLSNQDDFWYGVNELNELVNINLDNKSDIYNYGLTISQLNDIHNQDSQFWNKFLGGKNKIKFQFYLSINDLQENIELDLLSLQGDIHGTWKLQQPFNQSTNTGDYDLEISDRFIRVNIYSNGSYKVNYNFIDIKPPQDLLDFTQELVLYEGQPQIKLTKVPPLDYDLQGTIIRRKINEFPTDPYGQDGSIFIDSSNESIIYDTNDIQENTLYCYTQFPYDIRTPQNINLSLSDQNRTNILIESLS